MVAFGQEVVVEFFGLKEVAEVMSNLAVEVGAPILVEVVEHQLGYLPSVLESFQVPNYQYIQLG